MCLLCPPLFGHRAESGVHARQEGKNHFQALPAARRAINHPGRTLRALNRTEAGTTIYGFAISVSRTILCAPDTQCCVLRGKKARPPLRQDYLPRMHSMAAIVGFCGALAEGVRVRALANCSILCALSWGASHTHTLWHKKET